MTSRQKWHALVEIAHFFDKECDAQITRWENTDPDVPDIDRYVVILVDNKIVMLNMNWLSMTVIDCGAPV